MSHVSDANSAGHVCGLPTADRAVLLMLKG
jgi:hypothetical protein